MDIFLVISYKHQNINTNCQTLFKKTTCLPSGISSSGGWQHFKWKPRSHPSQNNMLS